MDDLIGQRLGQYDIVSLLGEGGMAVVYRARQTSIERDVAIKVIKPDLLSSAEFIARFQREATTTASLSHPHIRKVFDYGQHNDTVYLVSELIEGQTLADWLTLGPLPPGIAARVMMQMASALDYAHARGVIHRDLKPQNVLIDRVGNAFLTDFGLAKLIAENLALTQVSAAMGTPYYMAPEQWKGDSADAQTDNYGLGVMLFEMLTGALPFIGDTQYSLMQKHLYELPPQIQTIRPDLTARLDALFLRALAKERADRFGSALELADAFHAVLRDEGLLAPGQNLTTPLAVETRKEGDLSPATDTQIISASKAAEQERRALENIEAEKANLARTTPTRHRFVNTLPQDVSERYIGRARQQADIMALLTTKTRLISIYGRGGIGKTALACKILSDLQFAPNEIAPNGMVYLSATTTGISVDRIFADLGKLLDIDGREALVNLVRNRQATVQQKVTTLLDKLSNGRYILLLDSLEAAQDPATGKLTDSDLEAFFEVALEQGGALCILITSREPLALPRPLKTWERLMPLEDGLQIEDSISLLRIFDPDGAAGLREATDEQLRVIAEKTHGYPRALEAVAGLLLEDPLIGVDDLIRDVALLTGEITPILVQQAMARLNSDAIKIMEVLALLERPAPQTAIEFMLAPYIDTLALRATLARLVRAYFVSFNKATQTFALHAMDRAYFYSRLPDGSMDDKTATPAPYTRNALHYRAADYFRRQRKPRGESRSVDDLSPQVSEAEHLMQAGDYDTASELLLMFGEDYLQM